MKNWLAAILPMYMAALLAHAQSIQAATSVAVAYVRIVPACPGSLDMYADTLKAFLPNIISRAGMTVAYLYQILARLWIGMWLAIDSTGRSMNKRAKPWNYKNVSGNRSHAPRVNNYNSILFPVVPISVIYMIYSPEYPSWLSLITCKSN
jgi:hypothetical protein